MNEQDLKHALRGAMADASLPDRMRFDTVLDAAHRDRRRRRTNLAGAASAFTVAAVAAGAVLTLGPGAGGDPVVAAQARTTTTSPAPFPDGQTDRTATSGPRAQKAEALALLLESVVPEGMTSPRDLAPTEPEFSGPTRTVEAQFLDYVGDGQAWEYRADIPAGADNRWGRLYVEVFTPGSHHKETDCALTTKFWGGTGHCALRPVGDKQVGVVSEPTERLGFDQWAAYRHPDGTVVFLAQAARHDGMRTGLPTAPLTTDRLAELVTDQRFLLG